MGKVLPWLLPILAAAALGSLTGTALTQLAVNRTAQAGVAADNVALVGLSGFAAQVFSPGASFSQTGTFTNQAAYPATVVLTVDPRVFRACRPANCGQNANWTLALCWAPTAGGCTGSNVITFTGNGPSNPPATSFPPVSIGAGGNRGVFVSLTTNAAQFCAAVTFSWSGSYLAAGTGSFGLGHTAAAPRCQIYRKGGAACSC